MKTVRRGPGSLLRTKRFSTLNAATLSYQPEILDFCDVAMVAATVHFGVVEKRSWIWMSIVELKLILYEHGREQDRENTVVCCRRFAAGLTQHYKYDTSMMTRSPLSTKLHMPIAPLIAVSYPFANRAFHLFLCNKAFLPSPRQL